MRFYMACKSVFFLILCFGAVGCAGKIEIENISAQDTLNAPVTIVSRKKKNIKEFYRSENAVVFYTFQGCEGCEKVYPLYKKMAKKYSDKYDFGKVDIIISGSPPQDSIVVAPTVGIYKKGKMVLKLTGSRAVASKLEEKLKELAVTDLTPGPFPSREGVQGLGP